MPQQYIDRHFEGINMLFPETESPFSLMRVLIYEPFSYMLVVTLFPFMYMDTLLVVSGLTRGCSLTPFTAKLMASGKRCQCPQVRSGHR